MADIDQVGEKSSPNQEQDHEPHDSPSATLSGSLFVPSPSSSPSEHQESLADVQSSEVFQEINNRTTDGKERAVAHRHQLPAGWLCNYDPERDQYKFEFRGSKLTSKHSSDTRRAIEQRGETITVKTPTVDHDVQTSRKPTLNSYECEYGYHFPTSPTPSMISELAKQVQKDSAQGATASKTKQIGYGKFKFALPSEEEEQSRRLRDMFPTATAPVIDHMIRIYHGREGLIKAALISLGYKRAKEYGGQQATAQSPIMLMMSKPASKKLFDKLVSYFPDKDETLIKNLMYKHKEVEHEIISVLVESGQSSVISDGYSVTGKFGLEGSRLDRNGTIMKLRYLKFLFPDCREIELYHLLHCNNLNAQKVVDIIEKRGHKRANIDEVLQTRKSQIKQMKAQQAALASKQKTPIPNPVQAHKNRVRPAVNEARANNLRDNLKKDFQNVDDGLILAALDAADYNEPLARRFVEEMQPIDEEFYTQRYEYRRDQGPAVVLYPCKGTQKGYSGIMPVQAHEYVAIGKDVIECENALALLKVDASTFTQDDTEGPRLTHAKGKRTDLARGSIFKELEVKDSQRRGPKDSLRSGSRYEEVRSDIQRTAPNQRAKGHNMLLAQGHETSLRHGHNEKLLQRTHPFFSKPKGFLDVVLH